jgi:porin
MTNVPFAPCHAVQWRLVLAALAALWSMQVCAADASNADERTLVPSLSYDGDVGGVTQGGQSQGATYTGLLHLRLRWIVPTASEWRGTAAFIDVRNIHGGHLSELAGDAQGVSNVDGPDGSAVHELWIQHNFQWSGVSLLGGIYDLNSEFDRVQAAGLFLNSSFGVTPEFAESGATGPSIYPRTAAALRFAFRPWTGALLRAALVDGASLERPDGSQALFKRADGTLQVVEWSMLRRPDATGDEPLAPRIFGRFAPLPTYEDKVAIGAWHYSKHFAEAGATDENDADSTVAHHASEGAYVIGEWRIFGRGADAKKRVSGFAQLGFASPSTNRFGSYAGAGLVATGWLGKDADQVGISVASAQEGNTYRRNASLAGMHPAKAETTWEFSYLHQLKSWLTLAPDVQFVNNPNADAARRGALVLQLRSEITI